MDGWTGANLNALFFTLMVLTVSLQIWGLLLKERICSQKEKKSKFFPLRIAPNEERDELRLSHEKVYIYSFPF